MGEDMKAEELIIINEQLKDLEWEERLSLDYSNGLSSYWEIYRRFQIFYAFEFIKNSIQIIACVSVANTMMGIIQKHSKVRR